MTAPAQKTQAMEKVEDTVAARARRQPRSGLYGGSGYIDVPPQQTTERKARLWAWLR